MKLQIISDIHLEFHRDCGKSFAESFNPLADNLVIAGDLVPWQLLRAGSDSPRYLRAIQLLCQQFKQVYYVAGNHEYYGGDIWDTLPVRLSEIPNLHYLDDSMVEVDGYKIIGTTMWHRYGDFEKARHHMLNDIHIGSIRDSLSDINTRSVNFLENNIDDKSIVITHHAPTYACVHRIYERSEINCFYVCNMEDCIRESKPLVWIHGHMHQRSDVLVGNTRIVCNAFGYAGYQDAMYDDLVIEV